jgi:hypothetical protein
MASQNLQALRYVSRGKIYILDQLWTRKPRFSQRIEKIASSRPNAFDETLSRFLILGRIRPLSLPSFDPIVPATPARYRVSTCNYGMAAASPNLVFLSVNPSLLRLGDIGRFLGLRNVPLGAVVSYWFAHL